MFREKNKYKTAASPPIITFIFFYEALIYNTSVYFLLRNYAASGGE
jgi:hypothetical protein